ncbi:hypothetical protein XENOCAPTIV_018085 [Xenoophorus captivus]|uniref:Uncharacterized protein n=1 Tax=Xenoophorus captivus TaxID=1517983 RepID=A0ABV0RJJ5_9TELE
MAFFAVTGAEGIKTMVTNRLVKRFPRMNLFFPILIFSCTFLCLPSTQPLRYFAFTSHYEVWDDENVVNLPVLIQCCSCFQVRRRRLSHTITFQQFQMRQDAHKHCLLSVSHCCSSPTDTESL